MKHLYTVAFTLLITIIFYSDFKDAITPSNPSLNVLPSYSYYIDALDDHSVIDKMYKKSTRDIYYGDIISLVMDLKFSCQEKGIKYLGDTLISIKTIDMDVMMDLKKFYDNECVSKNYSIF